jgi:hypothetical protein
MGAPQSKYAGMAVIFAIIVVSISILFGKDSLPLSQKLGAILLLIIVSAPGILFSLFQLTCLVTGAGFRNQRWWCNAYAWIITALLVIYSVLLISIAILSISTNSKVISDLTNYNVENFANSMTTANEIAGNFTSSPSTAPSASGNSMMNSATMDPTTGNENKTDNKAYSYSSSVLPVLNENFTSGRVSTQSDNAQQRSPILGSRDTPLPYPYEDGTLAPLSSTTEKFRGTIGDANNTNSRIVGGASEAASFPFGATEGFSTGRVSAQSDTASQRTPILGARDTASPFPFDGAEQATV